MTQKSEIAIKAENLTACYDKAPVIWDVSFVVPKSSITAILGPNGGGKTTLLKTALGELSPVSGYIEFLGQPLKAVRDKVCYVPQRESVDWDFPITVLEVVLMGRFKKLGLFKWPKKADKEAALRALESVGMQSFANQQIAELSGGQKQRVFLARALLQESDVFLLDEPFSGVDAATESIIIDLFKKLRDQGKTFLIVHHDLHSVRDIYDHLIVLKHSLIATGKTENVFTQENLFKAYGKRGELLAEMIKLAREKKTGVEI